jgi:hypothetical protein
LNFRTNNEIFYYKFNIGYGLTILKYRHIAKPYPLAASFSNTLIIDLMLKRLFANLFSKKNNLSGSVGNYIVAQLNDKVGPIDRSLTYEEPLKAGDLRFYEWYK